MKSTKMNLEKMQLCNAVKFMPEDGRTTGDNDPIIPTPPKK